MATRNIAFGYSDVGTVNATIKRASDGYFWNPTSNVWQLASVVCPMTHDSDLDQYYLEEAPTERCYWTAYDSAATPVAISYGEYGGGFPDVSVGSVSAYTVQEVITRIRTEISDPDDGNPRFTDAQLMNVLDRCVGWLTDQCYKKKTTVGVGKATYTGDGTTEWGLPATFFGLLYFADPTIYKGGQLKQATKLDYDQGDLAASLSRTSYYALLGSNVYFMRDLATGGTINLYFYPKIAKLTTSTTVPFDGLFMDLMVEWGKTITLATDEFSIDRFQSGMFSLFMNTAKAYMVTRGAGPMRARVKIRNMRNIKGGSLR